MRIIKNVILNQGIFKCIKVLVNDILISALACDRGIAALSVSCRCLLSMATLPDTLSYRVDRGTSYIIEAFLRDVPRSTAATAFSVLRGSHCLNGANLSGLEHIGLAGVQVLLKTVLFNGSDATAYRRIELQSTSIACMYIRGLS